MVVFPYKADDPDVAVANLATAASHPRVRRVVAVGATEGPLLDRVRRGAEAVARESDADVEVVVQERIGDRRPGKGDGMVTGMRLFLASDEERLHFYDADITNFDTSWIDGAEEAVDTGFPVARHYFPRASTDAMITWLITRPLFAIGHPRTELWKIRQPLGGELLVTRPVVEELAASDFVTRRSDWGIDTAITYAIAAGGHAIYEHYVADGKQHALYGSLAELSEMVWECFEAAADICGFSSPPPFQHHIEPEAPAPPEIAHKVGYDVERTIHLLGADWTPEEVEAAGSFPSRVAEPLLENRHRPTFAFLDADTWYDALTHLLARYRPEPAWRRLLFRLWVARVLAYTTTDALTGHAEAMRRLESTVASYAARSGNREAGD